MIDVRYRWLMSYAKFTNIDKYLGCQLTSSQGLETKWILTLWIYSWKKIKGVYAHIFSSRIIFSLYYISLYAPDIETLFKGKRALLILINEAEIWINHHSRLRDLHSCMENLHCQQHGHGYNAFWTFFLFFRDGGGVGIFRIFNILNIVFFTLKIVCNLGIVVILW